MWVWTSSKKFLYLHCPHYRCKAYILLFRYYRLSSSALLCSFGEGFLPSLDPIKIITDNDQLSTIQRKTNCAHISNHSLGNSSSPYHVSPFKVSVSGLNLNKGILNSQPPPYYISVYLCWVSRSIIFTYRSSGFALIENFYLNMDRRCPFIRFSSTT